MSFQLLTPYGRDAAKWQSYLDKLPRDRRDLHFTPAYARAHDGLHSSKVYAALFEHYNHFAIQPFVLNGDDNLYISSLPGGGGPISNHANRTFFSRFDAAFAEWRNDLHVVCEYGQVHPFLSGEIMKFMDPTVTNPQLIKEAVRVDLSCYLNDSDLLASFSRNRQRGIKRAMDTSSYVLPSIQFVELDNFVELYNKSMTVLGADPCWLFPKTFWNKLKQAFWPDHLNILTLGVPGVSPCCSQLMILYGHHRAYAMYLGKGTNGVSTDILYFEAMKFCREIGMTGFFLGGGLVKDDALFHYKAGFGALRLPVFTYRRIFDQTAYNKACEGLPETDFFPAYRSPHGNSVTSQQAPVLDI